MNLMAQLLNEHYVNFPEMEIQDAVKFLYQHHMGPGHLVTDEQAAFARLQDEWDTIPTDTNITLSHPLGNGLCRLNLSACKAISLSVRTVARLFFLTAQDFISDCAGMEHSLDAVYSLPFPPEQITAYLESYRAQGCPMVSHSEHYRACYHPAYRVVSYRYVNLIPVLSAIDHAMASNPNLRVAIDGPCASGKSTLGAALSEIYQCPLIHMDDFFLRPEQRTPQRLGEPGGNVDYERFSQEILAPMLTGKPVRYRPWMCQAGGFGPELTLPPSPLTVVEGCYCLRPDLRHAFHLRIWVDAPWPVRQQRLLDRGGPDCLARFEQQWIPLENEYFEHYNIADICDIRLSGPAPI